MIRVARQRRLQRYGLSTAKSMRGHQLLHSFNSVIGSVVSLSESDVREKMIAAGIYHGRFDKWLFPLKYGVLTLGALGLMFAWLQGQLEPSRLLLYASVWMVVCLLGPDWYLTMRKHNLQRGVSDRLPYLLDLMGVCVQTGMTIESSMRYLAAEMESFDPDLAYMLKKTNERAMLVGIEAALNELYDRIPTAEIRSFVMTLSQSLQYGSSISNVLATLSVDIREIQMLNLEEKIGKLAAKMSVPLILFIMLPIVVLITAPGILRLMSGA
ncbi:type II secretion system F family protein [Vibrio sp. SM6]|uniref:Type II secretion system F family protein n=2 Tax=Vibrio agarilyticus TaxID=2726741 RepID=A0A7X8YH45_9VIBR|nr:type II secretion system F family protein [Vibrio agarilyticus]